MSLDDIDLKKVGEALHQRLLSDADSGIQAEISERFLPLLVSALRRRFPNLYDPHLVEMVAIDALLEYFRQPERFNPARGALVYYLYLIAYRDLLNLLEQHRRYVGLDAATMESMPAPKRPDDPESRLLDEASPLVRKTRKLIRDPVEQELLALMMDGVRDTSVYAEVLGIQERSLSEQMRLVKDVKDRLKKRVRRKMAYRRAVAFLVVRIKATRQWTRSALRKAAPLMVQLLAIAILITTNAYLWQKARAMPAPPRPVLTSDGATRLPIASRGQEVVTANGVKGHLVEKIFFASNRGAAETNNRTHIWMMNPDGTEQEQVTFGDWSDGNARVSPDGTKLAFQRGIAARSPDEIGTQSIWVKNLLTGSEQPLTAATDSPAGIYHSYEPAWSPDGTRIAFARSSVEDVNEIARIWVVEVSPVPGIPRQLTGEQGFHRNSPDWSPDGRQIVFRHHVRQDAGIAIFSIDMETGQEAEIIPCAGDEYNPRFSPDGSKIVWMTFRQTGNRDVMADVYVADVSQPKNLQFRITANSGWGIADWSPDGNRIVLTSIRRKLTEKALVKLKAAYAGKIPDAIFAKLKSVIGREISNSEERDALLEEALGEPAAQRYRYSIPNRFEQCDDLWIANADGSNFIPLTSTLWCEYVLDWALIFQPDADLVISAQVAKPQPVSGGKTTFTVTVTNNGAGTAKGVEVTNEISPAAIIESIASTGMGTVSRTSNRRTLIFPTLAPHQSESITIAVRIKRSSKDGAIISNTVSVRSTSFETNLENNSTLASVTVAESRPTAKPSRN